MPLIRFPNKKVDIKFDAQQHDEWQFILIHNNSIIHNNRLQISEG